MATLVGKHLLDQIGGENKLGESYDVELFEVRQPPRDEMGAPSVRIVLRNERLAIRIGILLNDVRTITLNWSGPWRIVMQGVRIADWSDRQLEGINWVVCDYETSDYEIMCGSAAIEFAERISPPTQ